MVEAIRLLASQWRAAALGSGLMVFAAWIGWSAAADRSWVGVRVITWWVARIVEPMLACRTWIGRCAMIFANNVAVLAVMVASGRFGATGILAVALSGLAMGTALRVLTDRAAGLASTGVAAPGDWRCRAGIALNLLEPPAIAAAIGLGIGRAPAGLGADEVYRAFLLVIVPVMWIAAGGEALWIGAMNRDRRASTTPPTDRPP